MTAIYTTFTIVGFMVGGFLNYFGAKVTFGLGGLGYDVAPNTSEGTLSNMARYGVYSAAWLCYNHTQNRGCVIFAGVLLGICVALIWCAHGTIMMVREHRPVP